MRIDVNNLSTGEKEVGIISRSSWVRTTSDDLNFDVESVLSIHEPIRNRKELDDRIRLLAVHILKFVDNQKKIKKTVAQYFIEIKEYAEREGYDKDTTRRIIEEIFLQYNVSESYIRRILPEELKDSSKSNIRYQTKDEDEDEEENEEEIKDYSTDSNDTQIQLKNALSRVKDLELEVRKLKGQLQHSVMIGQETRLYKGFIKLDQDSELPVTVAIDLKNDAMDYIEIDTEAIRKATEKY